MISINQRQMFCIMSDIPIIQSVEFRLVSLSLPIQPFSFKKQEWFQECVSTISMKSVFQHFYKSFGNGHSVNDWQLYTDKAKRACLVKTSLLIQIHAPAHMNAFTEPEKYERNDKLTCQLRWQVTHLWTHRVTQSGDS